MIVILTCFIISACSLQNSTHSAELKQLEYKANQGDIRSQSQMGDLYLFGENEQKVDYKKAFYWYNKAAQNGDAKSQYNLAIMYLNGYGVDINKSKAVEFYRKAAVQGDSDSQLQLGIRYLNGEGVSKDLNIAKEWFEKAKANGNSEAQYYIENTFK
ncbi:tetratricopeptide repeat protein [Acinetobacter shaoyimingii]|uniref:tetratricopeptide repeat protein n=1 Tax=Acinetobacter shaoyimingii TaxID=2715164 RepID=UPI00387807C6